MKSKLITAIFLFSLFNVKGQDIQQFLTRVQDTHQQSPQEKIYVHTDKPVYAAGETIYFKAYTTLGIHNLFSSLSGVLYAELISPANQVVDRVTISTPMGVGLGNFELQDTITEGVYHLRAYTNWMKNAGSDYFFDKKIPIYNGRSDNVVTHTTFEQREKDVLYKIKLNSLKGLPLAKRRVSYTIQNQGKEVERRSTTSSEDGVIHIGVSHKYSDPLIQLRFENSDKLVVNKIITAVNPQQVAVTEIFPEGGKLIAGRINHIAAKSLNQQGLGVKSTLVIKQGADTLGVLRTNELGMGASSVFINDTIPLQITAYYEGGGESLVNSPKIHDSGYSIVVNNRHATKLFAQLNSSSGLLNNTDVYFVVHHLGEVFFVSRSKLNKEEVVFSMDKEKLPMGVVTISILNSNFQPIIERPVFNYNPNQLLRHVVTLDKAAYGKRENVKVSLLVGNDTDSLRFGAFSASVIDLSRVNTSYSQEGHILSTLLIDNDVKGNIERPNFYFEEDGSIKTEDLDYLLLTQGWRNLDWTSVGVDAKAKYQPEKNLKISGYTKKIGRSKPEPNANVQLISTKNFFDFIDTTSNEDGYFEFNNLVFPDSIKFLISAKDGVKGKNNIDIIFEEDRGFPIDNRLNIAQRDWDINRKYLENLESSKEFFAELERLGIKEKAIAIEEVLVTRKQNKAPEYSSNLNGAGNADQIISAEELSTCVTLDMCLSGRLLGVNFQNGIPYNTRGNTPMQVVLDGMYIDAENLSMINITDIESVEVLRNVNYTTIYGSYGANGLLILTSKRGVSAMGTISPKGILTVRPQGFQLTKTFYKPAYDVQDGLKYNTDLRSSIHWEPAIVTDKDGKASFDFFTSDNLGKYLLIIEGIDLSGRILHKKMEVVVE